MCRSPPALAIHMQDGEGADVLEKNTDLWGISSPTDGRRSAAPEMALVIWSWLAAVEQMTLTSKHGPLKEPLKDRRPTERNETKQKQCASNRACRNRLRGSG